MLTPILGQSQEQLIGPQNLTPFQRTRMIRDTTLQSDESQTMIENEAEEKSGEE